MSLRLDLPGSVLILILAYRYFSRHIAAAIDIDESRPTPAHTRNDGVDCMPAKPLVLFGRRCAAMQRGS